MFNHQIGSSLSCRSARDLEIPNSLSLGGGDFQLTVTCLRSSDEPRQVQRAASTARRRNADFHIHHLRIMEGAFKGQDLLIKLMQ